MLATILCPCSGLLAQENGSINRFDRGKSLPTLKFSGINDVISQTFRFQCTDSIALKVLSVSLVDPESNFGIEESCDCGGFPVVTEPGGLLGVTLTLRASDLSVHYNQLRFNMGNGVEPIFFNVEGQRQEVSAGVDNKKLAVNTSLKVFPNPSHGKVTITLNEVKTADIDIFDGAGKVILTQKNTNHFDWDGKLTNGTSLSAGNYFVEARVYEDGSRSQILRAKLNVVK
ncbi:MAG: T9SS type A sorting domain-containing protein [Ignavibacteriota bacterium]